MSHFYVLTKHSVLWPDIEKMLDCSVNSFALALKSLVSFVGEGKANRSFLASFSMLANMAADAPQKLQGINVGLAGQGP